jgi:peptidyl-tRNA hydrolase, PTH1 family
LAIALIVGLGNPGERYAATRHNVGFMVADALARDSAVGGWQRECESLVCLANLSGHRVAVAKPLTFMNLSGQAVKLLLSRYGLDAEAVLLILDDLALPFGRIRIRERGSSGGHRGLESVIQWVDTDEVARIRVGIGEPDMAEDKAPFVLAEFPPERRESLARVVGLAAEAVKMTVTDGIEKAMSVLNAQQKEKEL